MATFEVTIETITVFPHPGADRLELARVGLYNIVVGKGNWATGDKVLYIPEYSVLPENLIIALDLEGKLSGAEKNRVKPVKLRGALSQGLVAPLSFLPEGALEEVGEAGDFAEVLGIKKWEPQVPASMSGQTKGDYNLINWIDIENLKKFPDMFQDGEEVIVDEKIHGTASLFTFINSRGEGDEGSILVSSKGLAGRKLILLESDSNVYWKVLRRYSLESLAEVVTQHFQAEGKTVRRVGVFGETFGSTVQDLHYGFKSGELGFSVFDIVVDVESVEAGSVTFWVQPELVEQLAREAGVPLVPRLYTGPFSMEKIAELATGREKVSGKELHIREGVVVRPVIRSQDDATHKIGKYVSEAYLTRKGVDGQEPTEFN